MIWKYHWFGLKTGMRCNTIRYDAMQCDAMLCYAMLCYAMRCNAMRCDAMHCYALLCNAMWCDLLWCDGGFGCVPGCSAINEPHGMKIVVYLHSILPCLWRLKAGCFDGWQRGIGRQCTRCFQSVVKVAQRWIATVLATTATTINICLL